MQHNLRRAGLFLHVCALLLALCLLPQSLLAGCDGLGGSGGDCGVVVPPSGVVIVPATFPDGSPVTSIAPRAFAGNGLITSIIMPDSVTNIGLGAFYNCYSLTNVAMGNGLVGIGENAFFGCSALPSVSIPKSTVTIGKGAFVGCSSLRAFTVDPLNTSYASADGVLFTKDMTGLLQYPQYKSGNYVIPGSVVVIAEAAFSGCNLLGSVAMSDGVEKIGDSAFASCYSLVAVTLSQALTSIGNAVFQQCYALHYITIPQNVASIGDEAFDRCQTLTNITIPNAVTNVGYRAFYGCSGLGTITIPASVLTIGVQAFSSCTSLTAISVDALNPAYSSVDGVLFDKGRSILIKCPDSKAGEYTIPPGVVSIAPNALQGTKLTFVTVPASVSSVSDFAFVGIGLVRFEGNAPSGILPFGYFPGGSLVYYLPGTSGWQTYWGGAPTSPWPSTQPAILTLPPNFGLLNNQFRFRISWATNATVVVEACSNLAAPDWAPVSTNVLSNGWSDFSDPQWANFSSRVYRVRTQ